ncbi:MAG TPA: M28 family peptidase [Gemmatimonadaceae bacterium]|nr:M28 family peptidase [Gemmatimonadaceae bacterium]
MTTSPAAERAADVVRTLAREPRPAGSDAEARARAFCTERLRAAGFDVREEPFEYSSFVGRWGTPVGGVAALALLLVAHVLARQGKPLSALTLLVVGAAAMAIVAAAAARSGVLTFPAERRWGVNLVATRGTDSPPLWLMAHLDSKSQPVPILARAAGVTLVVVTWLVSAALAVAQLAGSDPSLWWTPVGVIAALGAMPVIATTVGSRSPGALDNASGVATVLRAAERTRAAVGVCLTSAEELGLAGARAWVRGRGRATALNCDGVDDRGAVTCMYTGAKPVALVDQVVHAATQAGTSVRAHRLLPGVLTDGVALADAGWNVVTLSKGGLGTLARIHSSRDRPELVTGTGIAEVARLMAEVIDAPPKP